MSDVRWNHMINVLERNNGAVGNPSVSSLETSLFVEHSFLSPDVCVANTIYVQHSHLKQNEDSLISSEKC